MAVQATYPPTFIVDTEADRNTGWPNGSLVFCKDSKRAYHLDSGTWRLVGPLDVILRKGSDQAHALTTFADITGLGISIAANEIWAVHATIIVNSAAATTGVAVSLNGPASPPRVTMKATYPSGANTEILITSGVAYDTNGAGGTGLTTDNVCEINAVVANGVNAGTLIPRIRAEVNATITVKADSWVRYTRLSP